MTDLYRAEHAARLDYYDAWVRLHSAIGTLRGARRYGCDPAIVAECIHGVIEWRGERRATHRRWRHARLLLDTAWQLAA